MLNQLKSAWKNIRVNIRQLSGDDAYERYLAYYHQHQNELHANKANVEPLLSREAFFKEWQANKWKGIKRCC